MTEVSVHYAMSVRDTYEAGVSDAASQALSVLCFHRGAALDDFVYRHFPRHAEGDMKSAIVGVQNFMNTRMVAHVGVTAALHTQMESALLRSYRASATGCQMHGGRTTHSELSFKGEIHLTMKMMTTEPFHCPARGQTMALSTLPPSCCLRRVPIIVVHV